MNLWARFDPANLSDADGLGAELSIANANDADGICPSLGYKNRFESLGEKGSPLQQT